MATVGVRDMAGESVRSRILLKRYGKPEEVAYAVWFLASRYADYVTGPELLLSLLYREGEECGGGQGLTPMLRPGNPDHCGSLEVTGSGNGRLTADGRLRYASTSSSRSTRCSSHCPAAGRPFILTNIVVCRGV